MTVQLRTVSDRIREADAIVIGASNGLSISEGIHIFAENEDFLSNFGDFRREHGFRSIIQGCFHPFALETQKWAFFSRMFDYFLRNRTPSPVMQDLHRLVKDKPYFVVTSNIDAHFQVGEFDPERVFEIEGNCRSLQCASACHDRLYPGDDLLAEMARTQQGGKVAEDLVPVCPECGGAMQVHIEVDRMFLHDPEWRARQRAFTRFMEDASGSRIVFLELGVGPRNQLIKAPFVRLAEREPQATYVCFNRGDDVHIPGVVADKAIGVDGDIARVLHQLVAMTVPGNPQQGSADAA